MSEAKEEQGGVQVQEPKQKDSALDTVIEKQNERIPYELSGSEKLPGSRVRYSVIVAADTFNGKVDEILSDLRKEVNVPGFRRGKAPVALVRNRFLTHARQEAIRKMVPRISAQITEDCGVENLGQPVFEGWESAGGAAALKIVHEVRPEIVVTSESLAGLNAEVTEQPVDDARVEKELQALREKNAAWEAAEGAAFEKGDGLSLDSEVFDEHAVALEYLSRRNHYSQRIEQEFPASVVEALAGKKRGDVVEVDHAEMVGEGESAYEDKFHYKITLHEVKKRVLPQLDDDFAKDVSEEFKTLDDLRTKVRKDLEYAEEQRRRGEILEDIYKQLVERVPFDLPVSMVRNLANRSISQTEQRLREYGMTLRNLNADMLTNYVNRAHADATVEVRRFLLADQVGRFLDVQVTDEKLDAEIEKIAERQGRKPLAVRASLEAQKKIEDFRADLRIHAVNDRLIEMAQVKVVEKKESALPAEVQSGE